VQKCAYVGGKQVIIFEEVFKQQMCNSAYVFLLKSAAFLLAMNSFHLQSQKLLIVKTETLRATLRINQINIGICLIPRRQMCLEKSVRHLVSFNGAQMFDAF